MFSKKMPLLSVKRGAYKKVKSTIGYIFDSSSHESELRRHLERRSDNRRISTEM